ncbi:MAG: hypothetical protein NUV45_14980 [Tepidanaerobacteraceae bacterium]|jgi:hypothetical protein|nr:hypothetical protein [Tepidanaerobacteraceae bacterium]
MGSTIKSNKMKILLFLAIVVTIIIYNGMKFYLTPPVKLSDIIPDDISTYRDFILMEKRVDDKYEFRKDEDLEKINRILTYLNTFKLKRSFQKDYDTYNYYEISVKTKDKSIHIILYGDKHVEIFMQGDFSAYNIINDKINLAIIDDFFKSLQLIDMH